jgi:thymidylate synthase
MGHDDVPGMDLFVQEIKTNPDFTKRWGNLGPIYGKQWRDWNSAFAEFEGVKGIDQIQNLISDLKKNPDSRRLMVSAWNVGELNKMILPPCHYGFQVYTRELTWEERVKWVMRNTEVEMENLAITEMVYAESTPTRAISLMWNQRSCDVFLGLPFNIASYALLLMILAKEANMVPDQLIGNLGDTHLYLNHVDQAKQQVEREPYSLPRVDLDYRDGEYDKSLKGLSPDDFVLFGYQSHSSIKAPLSN